MADSNPTDRGHRSPSTTSDRRGTVWQFARTAVDRLRGVAGRVVQFAAVIVGAVSLVLAVTLVTEVGGDPMSRLPTDALASDAVVGFFGLAAGLVVLWALAGLRSSTSRTAGLPDSRASEHSGRRVAGADFDSKVARHANATSLEASWYDRDVRHRLTELAITVLREHTDADDESAAAALAEGSWTDDPRASAYFADGARPPLRLRLVDWANGGRYERQVEAVTDALADIAGIDTDIAGIDTGAASDRAPEPVHFDGSSADPSEWDEYETSWTEVVTGGTDGGPDAAGERDVEVEQS